MRKASDETCLLGPPFAIGPVVLGQQSWEALATLLCLSESPESWCLVGWMGTKDGHCRVPHPLIQLHHSLVSIEGRDALILPPPATLSVGQTVWSDSISIPPDGRGF